MPLDFEVAVKELFTLAHTDIPPYSGMRFGHVTTSGILTAAIGEFAAMAMNSFTGVGTEASAMVAMEHSFLRWLADEFGFTAPHRGGIIFTGASWGTLTALAAARQVRLGDDLSTGTLYVSEFGHFSVARAARTIGIPAGNVRIVPATSDLRMDTSAAEHMIRADRTAGKRPWAIVGTDGTTDIGGIDPLNAIADLADKYELHYHVDAALGGGFFLTDRGRQRMAGLQRADSVVWDPHKGWGFPHGTSILLTPDTRLLSDFYGASSSAYMPEPSADPDVPDFWAHSPELTRPNPLPRVLLSVRVHGMARFRQHANELLDHAERVHAGLASDPNLDLPWKPDLSTIAFRPRTGDPQVLLERLRRRGIELSPTVIRGRRYLHMAITDHMVTADGLAHVVDTIRSLAEGI
jgi:aromatic-L-amino-acid decarboxylase